MSMVDDLTNRLAAVPSFLFFVICIASFHTLLTTGQVPASLSTAGAAQTLCVVHDCIALMTVPDPPWKQKTRPCPFYSQGRCLFADSCNFLHTAKAHPSEGVIVAATESPLPSPPPTPVLRKRRQGMTPKLVRFRSPPRSPRMSSLLLALGDAIQQDGDEELIEDSESDDDEDLLTATVQTVTGSAILVEEPGELVPSEAACTHGSRSGSIASLGDATVTQRSIPLAEDPAVLNSASSATISPHVAASRDFTSASIGSAYSKENGRRSSIFVRLNKGDSSTAYEGSLSANQNALDNEAASLAGESTVIHKPVPAIGESAESSDSIELRSSFHQDGLIQATASPRVDAPRRDRRLTGSEASSVEPCNADIGVATPRLSCILALGGTRASITAVSVKSEANLKANPDGESVKQSHDYEESLSLPSGLLSPIEITATPPIELPTAASSASYMDEQRESMQSTFSVGSADEDERIMPSTFRASPPRSPRRVSMLSTLSSQSGSTIDRISPSMSLRSSLSRPTLPSRSEKSVIADKFSPSQFQDADSLSGRRSNASRDSMALASPVLNESEAEYTSSDLRELSSVVFGASPTLPEASPVVIVSTDTDRDVRQSPIRRTVIDAPPLGDITSATSLGHSGTPANEPMQASVGIAARISVVPGRGSFTLDSIEEAASEVHSVYDQYASSSVSGREEDSVSGSCSSHEIHASVLASVLSSTMSSSHFPSDLSGEARRRALPRLATETTLLNTRGRSLPAVSIPANQSLPQSSYHAPHHEEPPRTLTTEKMGKLPERSPLDMHNPWSRPESRTASTRDSSRDSLIGDRGSEWATRTSTKVPFGWRQSMDRVAAGQRINNATIRRTTSLKEFGTPEAVRPRPPVLVGFSPKSFGSLQLHDQQRSSPEESRKLRPLHLSIAVSNSASPSALSSTSTSVSSNPLALTSATTAYTPASPTVSSEYSLSNNPLLSTRRSSLTASRNHTLNIVPNISPALSLPSDPLSQHTPYSVPAAARATPSWRRRSSRFSSISSLRYSHIDGLHRSESRASEPAVLYEADEDAELAIDQYGGAVTRSSSSLASVMPPSPPHAIATPRPTLMFALASDNVEEVRRVLESGEATPNDIVGPQSALAFTLTSNQLKHRMEMVKLLLAYGADPSSLRDSLPSGPETPSPLKLVEGLDPATRYYVKRAEAPQTRRASALIHRSFFRPLARVRYDLIGQDRALEQLFRVLSMPSMAPIVVLLCGPSGHGKSLLARKFGSLLDVPTHTVNMTTLRSTHDIWRSYSMSPYEELSTCTLADFLVANEGKRCVVVLDEIEKAEDEKYLSSLLMPWELGRCSFEAGHRHVDVSKVIWLGTSNIGHDFVFEHQSKRVDPESAMTREEYVDLMTALRPRVSEKLGASLLSRVTTVLPFVPFTTDEKMAIASEALQSLTVENEQALPPATVEMIVRKSLETHLPAEGARSLYRAVSTLLLDTI